MSKYEQALEDHGYLWTEYGAANDMTGGYVDSEDLSIMLRSPSKATAAKRLISQIDYWFSIGPDTSGSGRDPDPSDLRLQQIAARYGYGDLYPSEDEDQTHDQ